MERRRLQIPSGMQDTLPGECAGKRRLEDKLRRLFTLGGYQEIETPILEYYDALDDQTFGYRPEQVWKTFDPQARILAVRPDSTIPAVRLASGRLKNAPLPLLVYVVLLSAFTVPSISPWRNASRTYSAADDTANDDCSRALSDRRVAAALDAAAMTTALTVSATSSSNSAISMDAPRCSCNFLRAAPMSVTCLPAMSWVCTCTSPSAVCRPHRLSCASKRSRR